MSRTTNRFDSMIQCNSTSSHERAFIFIIGFGDYTSFGLTNAVLNGSLLIR